MVGIDLFAGAGGMSLGATQAGIRVALAVESDAHATATYSANQPDASLFDDDIRRLTATHLAPWRAHRNSLIIFGGPPCQGFSWSNVRTRTISNPSNWLFEEFARVVLDIRPAWVVFENVQGFVSTARGTFFSQIQEHLQQHYLLHNAVLNAMHYGVPQDRSRFFLVGSRDGLPFRFPSKLSPRSLTVDDAIRDLPRLENGAKTCCVPYSDSSPSSYGHQMRARLRCCCNHLVTRNSTRVLTRYPHVPQGGNWQNIPSRLMTNYAERTRCHTGIYHRLRADRPSIVIGNYRKNMLIHPTQDRGLSVREAARIQSFPDWYKFLGSIGFQQQQVCNAVPPLLAKSVFQAILRSTDRA